ncbi:MAG: hybrid sensor histidine kinase/response regulator [Candidatus Rokuibacteriota bacterium]
MITRTGLLGYSCPAAGPTKGVAPSSTTSARVTMPIIAAPPCPTSVVRARSDGMIARRRASSSTASAPGAGEKKFSQRSRHRSSVVRARHEIAIMVPLSGGPCDGELLTPPTPDDEAAATLAAIVASSDDAIVSKTPAGIITSWNQAAERIFGYTAAEAIGQPITLIIPEARRAEEVEVLARVRRGERVDHFDTVRRAKDGRLIEISLTVSPIRNAQGKIIGASKIARDVTDRKRVEAERAALLADVQAANRAKDDFLAMFGHELRNPLGAIASAAHVLGVAHTVEDVSRPHAVIERQVAHLRRLIDDLLDAARVRTGKITLTCSLVNLAEAVDHALGVLQAGPTPTRHAIEVIADDVGVSGDPTRLEQIILNLLTNAIKYTPAGRMIRVSVRGEGEQAILEVQDDGVGISADALPRIFGLFAQGDWGLDRTRGGLGIGLALVRALVELHGGRVEAASQGVGCGSVFTVRLPRIALPRSQDTPRVPVAAVSRRRVLVVEDNDDAREMLRVFLVSLGHEVFEAADGAEAIKMVARLQPELAFVDLGLPIIDGFEVARYIRRQPHQPRRLVALTGYGRQEDRQRCLAAGFDEHLVKPIDPLRLTELLEKAG